MVSWLMTIKAVLISSGVASFGLLLKIYVPVAVDFSVSQAPILWSSLLTWLKPPYLYILTNGIIITIVASSKYYRSSGHHDEEDGANIYGGGDCKIHTEPIVRGLEVKDLDPDAQFGFVAATAVVYDEEEDKITDAVAMVEDESESELKSVIMVEDDVMKPPANSNLNHLPLRITESENLPPTDSRFSHRKSAKASAEGGRVVLRVRKPKRNETLENTWKMITEGKSTPLTRQFYWRSDTFTRGDTGTANPVYRKSETFRDRTNYYKSQEETERKVRKEPTLSLDELNRRVEAFIKKFSDDMRLQRIESLKQ